MFSLNLNPAPCQRGALCTPSDFLGVAVKHHHLGHWERRGLPPRPQICPQTGCSTRGRPESHKALGAVMLQVAGQTAATHTQRPGEMPLPQGCSSNESPSGLCHALFPPSRPSSFLPGPEPKLYKGQDGLPITGAGTSLHRSPHLARARCTS